MSSLLKKCMPQISQYVAVCVTQEWVWSIWIKRGKKVKHFGSFGQAHPAWTCFKSLPALSGPELWARTELHLQENQLRTGLNTNHSYDNSKVLSYLLFSWCMMRSCTSNRFFSLFLSHEQKQNNPKNQKRQWNFVLYIFHQDWILTHSLRPLNCWKAKVQLYKAKKTWRVIFFTGYVSWGF